MRKLINIISVFVMSCLALPCIAQDALAKFNEAETSYTAKDLDNSRYALQLALIEINKAIGKDILAILPTKLADANYNAADDNVNGAAGFAGLFVNRTYGASDASKSGKIEIISDSPMITALNSMLAMPAMFGSSDPNEKRLKISGYKSLLKKSTSDTNVVTYTLQVPMKQTLLTLTVNGISSETDVINFANALPLDKIAKVAE